MESGASGEGTGHQEALVYHAVDNIGDQQDNGDQLMQTVNVEVDGFQVVMNDDGVYDNEGEYDPFGHAEFDLDNRSTQPPNVVDDGLAAAHASACANETVEARSEGGIFGDDQVGGDLQRPADGHVHQLSPSSLAGRPLDQEADDQGGLHVEGSSLGSRPDQPGLEQDGTEGNGAKRRKIADAQTTPCEAGEADDVSEAQPTDVSAPGTPRHDGARQEMQHVVMATTPSVGLRGPPHLVDEQKAKRRRLSQKTPSWRTVYSSPELPNGDVPCDVPQPPHDAATPAQHVRSPRRPSASVHLMTSRNAEDDRGLGHLRALTADILWCRRWGRYAQALNRGLAKVCTGRATGPNWYRRRRLLDGRHPISGRPLV